MLLLVVVVAFVILLGFVLQIRNKTKLFENQSILSAIVNSSTDIIFSVTASGKILSWNKKASDVFQLSERKALELHLASIPEIDHDKWYQLLEQVVERRTSIVDETTLE